MAVEYRRGGSPPHRTPVRPTDGLSWRVVRLLPLLALVAGASALLVPQRAPAAKVGADWALPDGFALEIDTEGYELPTVIAFVPEPAAGPKSPLYFVSELRGAIKVVARDRTVSVFADVEIPDPPSRYPNISAQNGAAGMCLDPVNGYVFATYSAFGPDGKLRNAIVRFQSKPGSFGLRSTGRLDVRRIFAGYPTAANHQIGGCVVRGDSLFVGVGDGAGASRAGGLDSPLGKILRMTLDGRPYPGNPFASGDAPVAAARSYVWAYGLRNPFGLIDVGGQLFATHNGNAIDSFLRIDRGADYGWNGSDSTIAANAEAVISPGVGPVHLAYYAGRDRLFPREWDGTFFFGASVSSAAQGAGVQAIGYDLTRGLVTEPARSFVRFRRSAGGEVAGVALGPDGLYFAPLAPGVDGRSPVYRVVYDPPARYPYQLPLSGQDLWSRYGCGGCHSFFGIGGTVGPALDRPDLEERIAARLESPEYRQQLAAAARSNEEPLRSYRDERERLLQEDSEERVLSWLTYKIAEPRFDDLDARMPNLGLTEREGQAIGRFLLGREGTVFGADPAPSFSERVRNTLTSKRFAAGVLAGLVLAAGSLALAWLVLRARRRRPAV